VEELADTLGIHKNTVRSWIKSGLRPTDDRRPSILRGIDVAAFLNSRRKASKRPCGPGEIYCFKCRTAKTPDGLMADLEVTGPSSGRLVGICPTCATMLYRQVNPTRIEQFRGKLEITIRMAQSRLTDGSTPKLNNDFEGFA
jgi:hypothetical protein